MVEDVSVCQQFFCMLHVELNKAETSTSTPGATSQRVSSQIALNGPPFIHFAKYIFPPAVTPPAARLCGLPTPPPTQTHSITCTHIQPERYPPTTTPKAVSSGFKREAMPIEESRCPIAHPLDPHAASWGQQVRVVLVDASLHLRTAPD